jgi:DNA-binding FadR family transcriptional regulator
VGRVTRRAVTSADGTGASAQKDKRVTTSTSVSKRKASLQTARAMVRSMCERHLRPGDHYMSEAEGIAAHGVSRGTYREALRFLELQGVIVMRAGPAGGVEIAQPDWSNLASTIALLMQFSGASLRTILQARTAIEPGMAVLAARHATDEEIFAMAQMLDDLDENVGNFSEWSRVYHAYWEALARSSHNTLFATLSPALRAIVNSGAFVPDEIYRVATHTRLLAIHAAVASRDEDAAHARMLEQELEIERRLTEGYPREVDRVVRWWELRFDNRGEGR